MRSWEESVQTGPLPPLVWPISPPLYNIGSTLKQERKKSIAFGNITADNKHPETAYVFVCLEIVYHPDAPLCALEDACSEDMQDDQNHEISWKSGLLVVAQVTCTAGKVFALGYWPLFNNTESSLGHSQHDSVLRWSLLPKHIEMVSLDSAYASMATSSATPIGSTVFLSISFVAICLLTLLLLRRFLTLRATPAYITVPVFLALVLPASVVLLVPVDLASSSREKGKGANGVWLPNHAVLVLWRIAYWLIFCLTWVILPLLGDFVDSGYRDPKSRLMYSLRSNARYQLTVLCCGINGFDFTSIRSLVMALAYVWGLILAIYLMGHGLVSIPRSFFRKANTADALRRLQAHAPKIHDRLTDAVTELEEVEAQVAQLQRRKTGTARMFEDWIEELADYTTVPDSRPAALHSLAEPTAVPAVITERYMAGLSRRLQRARHQKARFVDEWDRLVRSAADYQMILNSKASKKLDFGPVGGSEAVSASRRAGLISPYMRYVIYVHVLPGLRLLLGATFSAASFCVVWSEVIRKIAPKLCIISLSLVPDADNAHIGLGGQLIASLWLLYMCTAALKGVNDAQVWGNRALVRRNTYGESACWYAGQVAKLTVPLAYNFLTLLPRELQDDTTFYHFLGQYINLTPLGKGFEYFPVFLLLPVCATMFNLYGRIKKIFGFGFVDDEEDPEADPGGFGTGGWREGRALIERELVGLGSLGLTSRSLDSGRNTGLAASSSSTSLHTSRAASPQPGWSSSSTLPRSSSRAPLIAPSSSANAVTATTVIDDGTAEEDNFFQSFAHRVRNTIDTASTPKWLQGGFPNISAPKWLNSSRENSGSNNGSTEGGNKIFGGLFGQRSSDGHVRL
ncbi:LMBR1 domain protein [Talaromyces stipitatus ATCC 10500]|uniref:LMBR1 domain protein n=1 Tax=Talaromyces stipitatus (strain ATCC 10500 / CBS 375.48 / QM 6759 / NRRL 1006) TaxID=441959 RepID=B8M839_TALSN|nr:LMBR1 domain protein [Talaromyces stipitatus ATCC 10500]EED20001.1 LMBR1 domain protein [Talaromyces stipitatus ATCC 10500]